MLKSLYAPRYLNDEPEYKDDENDEDEEVEEVVALSGLGQLQHLADRFTQKTWNWKMSNKPAKKCFLWHFS